ncbi:hypothetical protein CRG98_027580 [Punica granatum]|uniref:Uncharacterized protein n=1 Tax=Punica granatum TaxID=22663 RepID=A0A2I0J6Z8_PUNGR|nr:hypothetical protein CRG98_027580 [Punica granatum]
MTNDTSGRVSGASRVSRDTPDLSRTPFLTGLPGPDPLTRFSEGRFSGNKRLPVNLRGTSTENKDPNDPRTPQDIRGTLRKPRSQVPMSSRANGLRSRTTSQRSHTRQKGLGTFGTTHGRLDPSLRSPTSPISHRAVAGASVSTHFLPSCRGCLPLGSLTRSLQPESFDSHGRFPDSFPLATRLEKEVSEGSVAPRGPTATPLATGTVRFLGPPKALGLFLLEVV